MRQILIPSPEIQATMQRLKNQIQATYGSDSYVAMLSGVAGSLMVGNAQAFQTFVNHAVGNLNRPQPQEVRPVQNRRTIGHGAQLEIMARY